MPSLLELQCAFRDAIFASPPASLENCLPGGGESADIALGVYRSSILGNYRKTLAAVYPVVERLVGERFFSHAAQAFARQTPSLCGDLNCYGAGFAEFLACFPGADRLAYLPDVARLEWLIDEVFHGADPHPLPTQELSRQLAQAPGELRFTLAGHCRLLHSVWPVDRLWALNQPGVPWDDDFSIDSGPVGLMVCREEFTVDIVSLAPEEYDFLCALKAGTPLAAAFPPDAASAERLAALLGRLLAPGHLCVGS